MTQFIDAIFTPTATRSYAYANEGEAVLPGDFVEVETPNGSHAIIEVVAVLDKPPPFQCKPVIRKAERPENWKINQEENTDGE